MVTVYLISRVGGLRRSGQVGAEPGIDAPHTIEAAWCKHGRVLREQRTIVLRTQEGSADSGLVLCNAGWVQRDVTSVAEIKHYPSPRYNNPQLPLLGYVHIWDWIACGNRSKNRTVAVKVARFSATPWKTCRGFENRIGKFCRVSTDPRNFHAKEWQAENSSNRRVHTPLHTAFLTRGGLLLRTGGHHFSGGRG